MKCTRCDKEHHNLDSEDFCEVCEGRFLEMVNELKLAWIHQKGHPEKKTLWVHVR